MKRQHRPFTIYATNRRFLRGDNSFERAHRQSLVVGGLAAALEILAAFLLAGQDANAKFYPYLLICTFVLFPTVALAGFYTAYVYHRLVGGRFIEGQIVRSEGHWFKPYPRIYWWQITVAYRFSTPSGKQIQRQITRVRNDLREYVPPLGTPLKIRYVNDHFFRVM